MCRIFRSFKLLLIDIPSNNNCGNTFKWYTTPLFNVCTIMKAYHNFREHWFESHKTVTQKTTIYYLPIIFQILSTNIFIIIKLNNRKSLTVKDKPYPVFKAQNT